MKKNSFLIIVLLISTLFIINVSINAQSDQLDLLSKSINLYNSNEYSKALELNKSIDLDQLTTNAKLDTLYYRTMIHLALGDINAGKNTLKKLNDMGYDYGLIHYELARIYLNMYNNFDNAFYQTALEEFKKARSLGINSAQFHRDFAVAYIGTGNKNMAVQELELAVKQNGTEYDYFNIANLHKELGNLNKAENYFKEVLQINNQNTTAYSELGDVLVKQKKYEEAIQVLKEGVNSNPESLQINNKLGEAHYFAKNYVEAKKYLLKTIELKYNYYSAHYYLGKTYEQEEDFDNALYYLGEATKYNPDYVQAYIAIGDINLKKGNNYQAIANYSTAIEKNPTYPEGHFHLALAYYQADMKEAAISELKKTLHLSDGHSKARQMLDMLQGE